MIVRQQYSPSYCLQILYLNALGRDVEIVVKTKPKSRPQAKTRVIAK